MTNGTTAVFGSTAPAAEALRHFLVSNGGETGGWDARDHGLFLQWRSRFRNNRQTFVSAVCDTVPGDDSFLLFFLTFNLELMRVIINAITTKWRKSEHINRTGFFVIFSRSDTGTMDGLTVKAYIHPAAAIIRQHRRK